MHAQMHLLHACAPNARQLYEYTGETGFEELRFSKGRGRSEGSRISSMTELCRFLRDGEFTKFKCCRVKLPGQKIKHSAAVLVDERRIVLLADNGLVIAQISTVID